MKLQFGLLGAIVVFTGCVAGVDDAQPAGALRILLHDGPVDSVDSVWVTIDEVSVETAAGDWLLISDEVRTVDLLTLRDGVVEEVGLADLPAGDYTQIRLHIASAWVVNAGVDHDLTVPSGGQTGIKIHRSFTVPECGEVVLSLDWDVGAHLIHNEGRGYVLRPVIVVEDLTTGDSSLCDCAVTCDDSDPCTTDSCDASGDCVYTTDDSDGVSCDDGNACTSADVCVGGTCDGGPLAADGAACVAIVQNMYDESDVRVWDYYGDVSARWWNYQPYAPFDPAVGDLKAVTVEQVLDLTFSIPPGSLGDTYSQRTIFSGSLWTADSFTITDPVMSRRYNWVFDDLPDWTNAGWGYYFETRAEVTPHHVINNSTLTYYYEPAP